MTNLKTLKYQIVILALSALLIISTTASAKSEKTHQQLLIITPFPHFITQVYRHAFKQQYPDIELEIVKMGTDKAIQYLQEMDRENENIADIFWASSPETFKALKSAGIFQPYKAHSRGIPKVIAGVSINDSENYYTGYSLAGYGYMWNTRYMKIKDLPIPTNWESLASRVYDGHLAMSTPSRSSTTHVAIETILQTRGWQKGWELVKSIAANVDEFSQRSVHVPQKVQSGEKGVGIAIDYYALSSKAQHYPVDFAYPSPAVLLPASAAIIKNAPNVEGAKAFIDFLVSPEGQSLLLAKKSRRLPILPSTFDEAPEDYPNPYEDKNLLNTFDFDINLSTERYQIVNSLFEGMIVNLLIELKKAAQVINDLENKLQHSHNSEALDLLIKAKQEFYWLPDISDFQATKEKFKQEPKRYQMHWQAAMQQHYQQAIVYANQGLDLY